MWNLKNLDAGRPLYLAIADALERDIRSGELKSGDLLPTHRALAKSVGVTVSTVTRAYVEAEKRGLITGVVGKGTFVSAGACVKATVLDTGGSPVPVDMGLIRPVFGEEDVFREVVERVSRKHTLECVLRYTGPGGMPQHRETGAAWIRTFGIPATADSVLLTSGSQHAMLCSMAGLFRHGDRVAVGEFTYPGVKAASRHLGIRLEGVRLDEYGLIPEELETLCHRHEIRGVYINGRMQLPTNRPVPSWRREELARVIQRHNLSLVENDSYGALAHQRQSTLSGLIPESSVYIAGLSKACYFGMRLAFVTAPAHLAAPIAQIIADTMLLASPLNAELVCECINEGLMDTFIATRQREIAHRAALFSHILAGHSFICTSSCMAAWLTLPPGWIGSTFEHAAAGQGVRIYGAEKFAVGSTPSLNHARIALSGPETQESLIRGLELLKNLLHSPPPPV